MPRIRFGHKHMKINRALLISSVPTTNIKPCIRSLYIYTSFLKHTACNNSCGNIDNPPQIPPATICTQTYLVGGAYPHDSIYLLQHLFNNWFLDLDVGRLCAAAVLIAAVLLAAILLLQKLWGGEDAR